MIDIIQYDNMSAKILEGWSGESCQNNIDDCVGNGCKFGSTCEDKLGFYTCTCPAGITGRYCEAEINECAWFPCLNGGRCQDGRASFLCICPAKYTGSRCEREINACDSSPCLNQATCSVGNDSSLFICECIEGYTGRFCETSIDNCQQNNCLNGATCIDLQSGYDCQCAPGFTGSRCEVDVNECSSDPCLHGGICYDRVNSFRCDCPKETSGEMCEDNYLLSSTSVTTERVSSHQYTVKSNSSDVISTEKQSVDIFIPTSTNTSILKIYTTESTQLNVTQELNQSGTIEYGLTTNSSDFFLDKSNATLTTVSSESHTVKYNSKDITSATEDLLLATINASNPQTVEPFYVPVTVVTEKPIVVTDCLVIKTFRSNKLNQILSQNQKYTVCWWVYDSILPPMSNPGTRYTENQNEAYVWFEDTMNDLLPFTSKSTAVNINRNEILSYLKNSLQIIDNSSEDKLPHNLVDTPCIQIWMKAKRRGYGYLNTKRGDPNVEYKSKLNVKRRFLSSKMLYCKQNYNLAVTTDTKGLQNETKQASILSQSTSMENETTNVSTLPQSTLLTNKTRYITTLPQSTLLTNRSTRLPALLEPTSLKTKTMRILTISQPALQINETIIMPTISERISLNNKSSQVSKLLQTTSGINKTIHMTRHAVSTSPKETTTVGVRRFHLLLRKLNRTHYQERFSSIINRDGNKPKMVLTVLRTAKRIYQVGSDSARKVYRKTKLLLHMTLKQLSTIWISVKTFAVQPISKTQETIRQTWLKVNKAFTKTRQLLQDAYMLARNNFKNIYQRMKENTSNLSRDSYQKYYNYYNSYSRKINKVSGYFSNMYKNYTNNLQKYWEKFNKYGNVNNKRR
ncbi:neurogenic locus notch homolog 2 [Octopus vulgaris]|uniref:Neurogenic locus notch homolog 2 n=1 Tax=Octopus vulgaris TaxID=6645 RepID=A0AA36BDC5_OCTVU|nr:neurogenic locus notch homolog 2 [Octopus vulgaris]